MKVISTEKYAQITTNNPLDGRSRESAKRFLYRIVDPYTKNIYSDLYWKPIQEIWKAFSTNGLDWEMTNIPQYSKDNEGRPNGKEWYFTVHFKNDRNVQSEIIGVIKAAGAGSVQDPLERYDLVIIMQ